MYFIYFCWRESGQDHRFAVLSKFQKETIDSPVSSLYLTAQPSPPKIHEGWWAYKEVVQGSFVPGKPPNCKQHFDTPKFHAEYWFSCIQFRLTVCLILKSELIAYLRLYQATLPLAKDLFSHSGKMFRPSHADDACSLIDWQLLSFFHFFIFACKANYFQEIVFFCWAEGLLIKPVSGLCECLSTQGSVYACEEQMWAYI